MCPTICAKPPGKLRADPGADPPLASARQAGVCHHPALCPHLDAGVAGGGAASAGRVSRYGCRRISVKTGRRSHGLNSCGRSMHAIWMSIIITSSPANAAYLLTGSILMMPNGSACMTPDPPLPSVRPRICSSAAGCSACPPAGSTGCGWASAATSGPGPPSACCERWVRPTR